MKTLLIVDDDEVDRELARRCVEGVDDLEFVEARDGEEALASIAGHAPDLVLTDLRMPRLDGLELVRRLHGEHPDVPVVLMTGEGSEKIALSALRAGAASYVPKDVMKEELAATLGQVLEMLDARQSRRQLMGCLGRVESSFSLANDPELIPALAGFFQENLERIGFGDDTVRNQIGMALVEAVSNAMIHGNLGVRSELRRRSLSAYRELIETRRNAEPFASRRVHCEARERPDEVEYVVADEGDGFDPAGLPDPRDPGNVLSLSGRGVFLIRTFMDDVAFENHGAKLVMRKRSPDDRETPRD